MQGTVLTKQLLGFSPVPDRRLRSHISDRFKLPTAVSLHSQTRFTSTRTSIAKSIRSSNIDNHKITNSFHTPQDSRLIPRRIPHPTGAMKNIISYFSSQTHSSKSTSEKPKWWWRTLACLPYLMAVYDHRATWIYAYQTKNPSPLLKLLDAFTFPLFFAICQLPNLFISFHLILSYFGIVRQEKWPYFLRLHVMTAVLLGAVVQCIGVASGWCPSWFFPPHFWSLAIMVFLVVEFKCLVCALCGTHPSIPIVSEAASLYADLRNR